MSDERACDQSCQLARREFLGAAAVAALALLEAACGNGQIGPVGLDANATSTAGLVVTLSKYAALATTGGIARVDGGSGAPVALVRTGAASFLAFSLRCPHQGFTVSVQGGAFYCQAHGARFSSTGVNNGGQRTSNLVGLTVSYDATAGTVTIG
jgi:cytochrome b6-f complex iron-sulfur subunit